MGVRLCIITPFPTHAQKTKEEAGKDEGPSASRRGRIELVNVAGRYSFSGGEDPMRNARSATPSDVFSVNKRRKHHHALELTLLLPIQPLAVILRICLLHL